MIDGDRSTVLENEDRAGEAGREGELKSHDEVREVREDTVGTRPDIQLLFDSVISITHVALVSARAEGRRLEVSF